VDISRLTDCLELNHSTGMENVRVILLVLEELSNDTEDQNVVPESIYLSAFSLNIVCTLFCCLQCTAMKNPVSRFTSD
jgi:hypothetical protein